MPYAEGQQVEVWIDQNNLHPWLSNPTQNWKWTLALVTSYDDNPPCVRCLVASSPYMRYPVLPVAGRLRVQLTLPT
eukprot:11226536-Ditylum_brightwellii.AAC.1